MYVVGFKDAFVWSPFRLSPIKARAKSLCWELNESLEQTFKSAVPGQTYTNNPEQETQQQGSPTASSALRAGAEGVGRDVKASKSTPALACKDEVTGT